MIRYDGGGTIDDQVKAIMTRPEAYNSYLDNGHGLTFYDYVKMIVVEYEKIAINVKA
jgi:hypothetical protein